MGSNCCSYNPLNLEDYIQRIFRDKFFYLKNYDYNTLLDKLCDIKIQQEFHIEFLETEIIPLLYEQNIDYPNKIYHKSIFSFILSKLNHSNNMYEVLLLLYPFINHDGENWMANIYLIFSYTSFKKQMTLNELLNKLEFYLKFVTFETNNVIIDNTEDETIKSNLINLNSIYNDKNINKYLAINFYDLLKTSNPNDIITQELFYNCIKDLNLAEFECLRGRIAKDLQN